MYFSIILFTLKSHSLSTGIKISDLEQLGRASSLRQLIFYVACTIGLGHET